MSDTTKKKETQDVYILDWLIHKPVRISGVPKDKKLQAKDKVIYTNNDKKDMLGVVLGYTVKTSKTGVFVDVLNEHEEKQFLQGKEKAEKLFVLFKEEFTKEFPTAVPVTARMNLQNNQVYFYFFAEERFNFSSFVKIFRPKVGCHFFIYQVGPRDRIRLHPRLEERYDPSGLPLMYHIFKHSLDNVDKETLDAQQLGGRQQARMKDRSGKLDHTINFEKDFYISESKKYPHRGSIVQREGKPMKCMGYNILTKEIKLRGKTPEEKSFRKDKKKGDDKKVMTRERKRKETTRFGEFKKIQLEDYIQQKK